MNYISLYFQVTIHLESGGMVDLQRHRLNLYMINNMEDIVVFLAWKSEEYLCESDILFYKRRVTWKQF